MEMIRPHKLESPQKHQLGILPILPKTRHTASHRKSLSMENTSDIQRKRINHALHKYRVITLL